MIDYWFKEPQLVALWAYIVGLLWVMNARYKTQRVGDIRTSLLTTNI